MQFPVCNLKYTDCCWHWKTKEIYYGHFRGSKVILVAPKQGSRLVLHFESNDKASYYDLERLKLS